jgi:nuclear transport factor 2 (NTF2) superfamily protein
LYDRTAAIGGKNDATIVGNRWLADRRRIASINDRPIEEAERKYHWPLGRR